MENKNKGSSLPEAPSISPASQLAELTKCVGVLKECLQLYQELSCHVVSLEAPLLNDACKSSSGSRCRNKHALITVQNLGDLVSCNAPKPKEEAQYNATRQHIWQVLETKLMPMEQQVILH
ncbi:hypothetical protein ACA910_007605 [Epithemia clementina (nom. ined.)]